MNRDSIHPRVLLTVFLVLLFGFGREIGAQEKGAPIKEVSIQGNLRIEEDGIRLHLRSKQGGAFDPALVEQDVKSIYRMGYFEDVKAEISSDNTLTYIVKERPYVREVKIDGSSQVGKDKIETALGIRPRTILDRDKIVEGIERVKKLYGEQGYMNAQVDYAVTPDENNQATVYLSIKEGQRLLIQKISFEGNRAFSEDELKGVMATKEESILSLLTNRGVLDRDILTNDTALLATHYFDHGYVQHKIDEPVILKRRDGIEVVIRVEEGQQYRVGKVEIGGDMIEDPTKLLKSVKLTTGQIFRGSRMREDLATLTEHYTNKGFAFAQVDPMTTIDDREKKVNVALLVTKGPPVYFNRVLVTGNSKTRDKVVRRELDVAEQELFSADKLKQSRNALQRTGYFQDVQLTTQKIGQPDTVDLLVDVKEGPTGVFSIGAGYSSGDAFIFQTSVAEKNLFGTGRNLSASFNIGSTRQDFVVGFTEPYFNDRPLSLGVDAFNTSREYEDFTQRKTGMGLHTSYPLKHFNMPFFGRPRRDPSYEGDTLASNETRTFYDFLKAGMAYEFTREKIGSVGASAPVAIADEAGTSWTSAVTPSLTYDSRDHFFNATTGTLSSVGVKFAGLGGTSRFIKADTSARWYYPVLKDPRWGGTYTVALGGSMGYGIGFADREGEFDLPLFERYFPGGINSVRGFQDRSLGPRMESCEKDDPTKCTTEAVGGDTQAILNVELLFPIMEEYGLRGVAFFDMGQAFGGPEKFDLANFRRSVGIGGRWMSPFGPLRVELGLPLNKKPGDETSVLGFSLGTQP
ncbi:MAG: outer membrane protein assembly factor BamA [Candidatus Binatia bacterium]